MSRWIKIGVGAAIALCAIAYLFWSDLSGAMVTTRTVPEFLQAPQGRARVTGSVKAASVTRTMDGALHFVIEEDGAEVPVVFHDTVPDMFAEGRPVVIEGQLESEGVFHADTLLTKCPSKYEGLEGEPPHPTPEDGAPEA